MEEQSSTPRAARRLTPSHSATAAVYRDDLQLAYAIVTNVSRSGACIVTDSVLPPGLDVRLKISFYQHPRLIETSGFIVWNRRGRPGEGGFEGLQLHGVRFTATPPEDGEQLGRILAGGGFTVAYEPPSEFDRLQTELSSELDRLGSKLGEALGGSGSGRGSR